MDRRILLVIALAFFASATYADDGDGTETGNGGGGIEQLLLYSWSNLGSFVSPCLADSACYSSPDGLRLLKAIESNHGAELRNNLKLIQDEASAVVVITQPNIGAPMTLNLAPLYNSNPNFFLHEALELLVRALAVHHPGLLTAAAEEGILGLKEFWHTRMEGKDMRKVAHREISLLVIRHSSPALLLGTGKEFTNILPAVEKQLDCFGTGRSGKSDYQNFYWMAPERRDRRIALSIRGRISYECGDSARYGGEFVLTFSARVENGSAEEFMLNPGNYSLEIDEHPAVTLFDIHTR